MYLVGGVPGLGGCTWSWGAVPGPRGVPDPGGRGCTWSGGCTWSRGGVPGWGLYLVPGGVPGLGGVPVPG